MRFAVCLLFAAIALASPAGASGLAQQRADFVAAEKALNAGDMARFFVLERSLRDYPLHPYLTYAALRKRLGELSEDEVSAFLGTHAGTPVAWRMRRDWLNHLAAEKRWSTFLDFYQPSNSVTRQCQYLTALLADGRIEEVLPQVEPIWLHGESRPDACDPVLNAWRDAGMLSSDLTWQRIELAMAAGQTRLARYLGRYLPANERDWLQRWVSLHRSPDEARDSNRFNEPHPYREVMLVQAVRRLAIWDGMRALNVWQEIRDRYPFDVEQVRDVEHYIIRNLVREPHPEAYDFIRSVEVDGDATLVHAARVRAALQREDWPQVASWIAAMSPEQRNEVGWRYWLARATEGMGDADGAREIYADAATERTYYGFLAADRIGAPYHLAHVETPVDDDLFAEIAGRDGIRRAKEFFALERWTDARREWRAATDGMDIMELKAAAKFAKSQGWHDRAIFTLAKTEYWDDLELRFPLEHAELVQANADRHGIDIAWIFAVMRQESAFMQNARSHAGAMGLMQLMPATARGVALDMLQRKPPRRYEILHPDTNIALGSAYLKQMKGELGNSSVLATAAYNAGPHRVNRWLPQRTLPADIWIELVPFRETRGYLRRVLAYTVIYEKRLGLEPKRLHERLHPVPPNVGMLSSSPSDRSAG